MLQLLCKFQIVSKFQVTPQLGDHPAGKGQGASPFHLGEGRRCQGGGQTQIPSQDA